MEERSRSKWIVLMVVLAMAPAPLWGQIGAFERSYFVVAQPTPHETGAMSTFEAAGDSGNLLTEAQILHRVPLLTYLTTAHRQAGVSPWRINLRFTFQFRLRVLEVGDSAPIRSPSYMPRFKLQLLRAYGGRGPYISGFRNIAGLHLVLGHHSNGGDGCVFADQDPNTCDDPENPASPSDREVRRDGEFSTNYYEFGAYHRLAGSTVVPGVFPQLLWGSLDAAVTYQRHVKRKVGPFGGAHPDFAALYGDRRLRVEGSGHLAISLPVPGNWYFVPRIRLSYESFTPRAERFPGADTHVLQLEANVQLATLPGVSTLWDDVRVGVRFIDGQDYYNTHFARDIRRWQVLVYVDRWTPWIL